MAVEDDHDCPPPPTRRALAPEVTSPTAPLDADAVAEALRPFGESRMLPVDAYAAENVYAWEQHHFFEGGWICVGRSQDLGSPGDQMAERVGRSGVLLVRGVDGELRAFANTCRHRGHELAYCGAGVENKRLLVCPYHGWSYRLDGSLHKAPGYEQVRRFDPSEHGLAELAMREWHGYVFVNVSGGAGPLDVHLDGLEEIFAPYEPERLEIAAWHEYTVAANWKVMSENYQECYHCPAIHPQLCKVSPPSTSWNFEPGGTGAWIGGRMELAAGMATMSLDGRSGATPLRGLGEAERNTVAYIGIVPNLLVSLHPDYVMTHLLLPLGPEKTQVLCDWAFAPEDLAGEGFNPSFAVEFWDLVNRQDWAACESVQRGLASPAAVPGLLSAAEDAVYQFVTMIARGYQGRGIGRSPDAAGLAGVAAVERGGERG